MSELIKRNWGFVLIFLALVLVAYFFWPKKTEEDKQVHTSNQTTQTPPVEKVEHTPAIPAPTPEPAKTFVQQPSVPEEEEEEVYVEPEVEDADSRNFILCEHIVSGETQYEFTGEIRLINRGHKVINGWRVHWEYPDGSTIVESSEVALSGNNPYTGEYLSWNAEIAPNETVTFSFTGIKNGDSAPMGVKVTGPDCI